MKGAIAVLLFWLFILMLLYYPMVGMGITIGLLGLVLSICIFAMVEDE